MPDPGPPAERSAADLAHAPSRPYEVDLADRMARPLCGNFCLDRLCEVIVGAAAAKDRAEVALTDSEQTASKRPLRGQAHPIAVGAEGTGHARNDADDAGPVKVAVPV